MVRFIIDVYNHGAHIRVCYENDKEIMFEYSKSLTSYGQQWVPGRGRVRKAKDTYGTFNSKTRTFGFHANLLPKILEHLKRKNVLDTEIKMTHHAAYEGTPVTIKLKEGVAPRDKQGPVIEDLLNSGKSYILPAQPGYGKTFTALYSCAKMGVRTLAVMGASHLITWQDEIKSLFDVTDEKQIRIIRGGLMLKKLIKEAQMGELDCSFILVSVNTMRDYINEYLKNGTSGYGCNPIDLFKLLGVGFRIGDEAHENLNFNFKLDTETSVAKCLYLSATIESHDKFKNMLYETIFPLEYRCKLLSWEKYIISHAIAFTFEYPRKLKYKDKQGNYSHNVLEQSIMENADLETRYYDFVKKVVDYLFFRCYQEGQKCIIFFASVDMCARAAEFLSKQYPDYSVVPFTREHPEENLKENDIVCTTVQSAGTGKDVKKLATAIMTNALNSREKNIQVPGRLRPLDRWYEDTYPNFGYFVALNIPVHQRYHDTKHELFQAYMKERKLIDTGVVI